QANGIRGQVRSKLCRNCSHTARRNRDISLGKHLKHKFKHAAGRLQFVIKKTPAKEGEKKAMNEFFGESAANEGVCGGALGTLKNLINERRSKPRSNTQNTQLV